MLYFRNMLYDYVVPHLGISTLVFLCEAQNTISIWHQKTFYSASKPFILLNNCRTRCTNIPCTNTAAVQTTCPLRYRKYPRSSLSNAELAFLMMCYVLNIVFETYHCAIRKLDTFFSIKVTTISKRENVNASKRKTKKI